jgi:hypothetical protein
MQPISIYRYRTFDPAVGVRLFALRMGTQAAIETIDAELIREDVLTVNPADLDAAGWTEDGYWHVNKPPYWI